MQINIILTSTKRIIQILYRNNCVTIHGILLPIAINNKVLQVKALAFLKIFNKALALLKILNKKFIPAHNNLTNLLKQINSNQIIKYSIDSLFKL